MIVLLTAALLALQPAGTGPRAGHTPAPKPVAIAPATWLIPGNYPVNRQPDGNSLVLEGSAGLLVFDTGRHPEYADAINALVTRRRKPLKAIVNSHWHLDHISGNPAIRTAHAEAAVYSSSAVNEALTGALKDSAITGQNALDARAISGAMADDIAGDLAMIARAPELRPNVALSSDLTKVSLGNREIELHVSRNAVTAGDVWLYDPRTRILASGDLVTLPVPFLDTACPDGWKQALARIASVRFASLVPGHGAVMRPAALATYQKAFNRFVDCAQAGEPAVCASGWMRDARALIARGDRARAPGMAKYYAQRIRSGELRKYCR